MTDRNDDDAPLRGRDLHHEEGRGDALRDRERPEEELRGEDARDDVEELSRDDVMEHLSLDAIATLTGLPRPVDPGPDEERTFRELAWENVKLDIEARDEWGGVNPDADADEDPGLERDQR
jgi:hypothetical protein